MRVLIVDDSAEVRQELQVILGLIGGVQVVGAATDGTEAIALMEVLRPEVILMDLEMPLLDGYEATRRIKACWPSCRVVALTAHGYEAARQRAIEAGVDEIVVKGEAMERVIGAISRREG